MKNDSVARTRKQRLRALWLQVHKWIGITLAILIIPISLTGAALVWDEALDALINPQRHPASKVALPPSAYAGTARNANNDEALIGLDYPEDAGAVVATFAPPRKGPGRPLRTFIYLDPADARILDRSTNSKDAIRVMHVLHGSLMVPGTGRQIVGWVGVAMLISSVTGLWLWWPVKGSLRRGLRWKRQGTTSANLHHMMGFWISLPLAVLSFTGVWIALVPFFAQLSGISPAPNPAERMRRMNPVPVAQTRLDADQVLDLTKRYATGALMAITWPTTSDANWKVSYQRVGGSAEVQVGDDDGKVTPPSPPRPETTARLMRRIHDGTGTGPVWQAIIFVGGIIPAVLAVTGIMMWLNVRRRRRDMEQRRSA